MADTDILLTDLAAQLGISAQIAVVLISIIFIWSLAWKGFALWKSCRKNQYIWFIIFLLFNTLGILEILYIFLFSKINLANGTKPTRSEKKKKSRK